MGTETETVRLEAACEAAREMGREAGRAAGSWAADGNTSEQHARKVLALLDDGAPEAYYYLPRVPDLSGEWADAPTPASLLADCGYEADEALGSAFGYDVVSEALCAAWEEGVGETFEPTCEAELRSHVPEPVSEERSYSCPRCGVSVFVHVDADVDERRPCEACEERTAEIAELCERMLRCYGVDVDPANADYAAVLALSHDAARLAALLAGER